MAAAPVTPPSGDDAWSIGNALLWIRDWGWGVILPAGWYVRGRVAAIEERQSKIEQRIAAGESEDDNGNESNSYWDSEDTITT